MRTTYDLLNSRDRIGARLGIEMPMPAVVKSFVTPGESFIGRPRPHIEREFLEFEPQIASAGKRVPVIHMRSGCIYFGIAKLGRSNNAGDIELFRAAEQRMIGSPGLIPVSFIDQASRKSDSGEWGAVRLQGGAGIMFVGCIFVSDAMGKAEYVMPLIRKSGPTVSPHADWELLLVSFQQTPQPSNFAFLQREDNGRLQVADTHFRGEIEVLNSTDQST